MCCKTSLNAAPPTFEAQLAIGLFIPAGLNTWIRKLDDDAKIIVEHDKTKGIIEIHIFPTITAPAHHASRRIAASVMFEIAAKIAEKGNCDIYHHANIAGCYREGNHPLASYPYHPFEWTNLCPGFVAVFMGDT